MSANAQPSNCTRSWERVLSQRFAKHFETSSELGRGSHKVFAKSADAQKQDPRFADAWLFSRSTARWCGQSRAVCTRSWGGGKSPQKATFGPSQCHKCCFRHYSALLGFTRIYSEALGGGKGRNRCTPGTPHGHPRTLNAHLGGPQGVPGRPKWTPNLSPELQKSNL